MTRSVPINSVLFGEDLFGEAIKPEATSVLADRFGIPPFSVLNAREGAWQERKRAWISLGIKSEVGRDAVTYQIGDKAEWEITQLNKISQGHLISHTTSSSNAMKYAGGFEESPAGTAGTSIFDPVLCELIYNWFCPEGGQIVDPFAGGSVRGIVATLLGKRYWGCDLRQEQIEANNLQADEIKPALRPYWICGDSMDALIDAPEADLVFSCPPYGDLEKYSDDPRDLSSMEWHTFVAAYKRIILRSVQRMKQDSFACFVVGDFRDPKGFYRNFVSKTIEGFEESGAKLYNEAILLTCVGSLPIRVSKQFESGRKLGKTHQNVLVFCKGDWRKASAKCNKGKF